MGFDIDKLEKNIRMLQQLPGISFRKRADRQTLQFTPEQIKSLEDTICEDIYYLVKDAGDYFEKRANEPEKKTDVEPESPPADVEPVVKTKPKKKG